MGNNIGYYICGGKSNKSIEKEIRNKIVKNDRRDIIVPNPENIPLQRVQFTELFAIYCKKFYESDIQFQLQRRDNLYIEFECMLPNCCETWDMNTNKNVTNRFHVGDGIDIAFIRNHNNRNEYIPLRPVFEIIRTILENMNHTYIVSFERLVYNTRYWEEGNAVLTIYIVQ